MKRKKKERIYLLNGCYHTEISVTPETWQRKNASTANDWVVWYRYYDPKHHEKYPSGKYIPVQGMNGYKDLVKRQEATRRIIKMQEQLLQVHHYNPITGSINNSTGAGTTTDTSLLSKKDSLEAAIHFAFKNLDVSNKYRTEIRVKIPHILEAAKSLLYDPEADDLRVLTKTEAEKGVLLGYTLDKLQFPQFKLYHAQVLLKRIGQSDKLNWTNNNYNAYKKCISSLFNYLFKAGYISENPVKAVPKLKHTRKDKELQNKEETEKVLTHLRAKYYTFYRFAMIFWKSGTRITELMRVKLNDVDLQKKGFWATVKKTGGGEYKRVWKSIDMSVLHLWRELLDIPAARHGDYFVFGKHLRPNEKSISEVQVTRRWTRLVKNSKILQAEGIYVKSGFYDFKHDNTTSIVDREARDLVEAAIEKAQEKAAAINSHASTKMVKTVYDLRREKRKIELLRLAKTKLTAANIRRKVITINI